MKKLLVILLIGCLLSSCLFTNTEGRGSKLEKIITAGMEYAYMEGQKDALNGEIHVELSGEEDARWISNFYDSGKEPIFEEYSDYEAFLGNL